MADMTPAKPNLWRNGDFVLLLSGQVVSYVGDQAQLFALPLLVLALSGSATLAGLVLGLNTASFLVFGLVAGAFVDRWDRRITMICCEIGRALLVGSIAAAAWLGHLATAYLCVVAVATGVLATLFEVADTASLPNVVAEDQLSKALGYSESAFNTVRVFGASLAGVLYALGRALPFAVNAVSFVVSAFSLRFMRATFQQASAEDRNTAGRSPSHVVAEIREGLGWLWRRPAIRFLTLAQAADRVRYGAGYLVIIVVAQGVGAKPVEIGLIFSGAAIGALLGALASARVMRRFALGPIAVTMLWVEALMFPLYAVAPDPFLVGCVAAAESVVAPIYAVAMTTYRLAITPDELRGRTSSVVSTLSTGAMSLGTLIGGVILAELGAKHTVLLWSAWLLALAAVTSVNGSVRRAPKAGDAAPAAAA
jgi:MFS family permease